MSHMSRCDAPPHRKKRIVDFAFPVADIALHEFPIPPSPSIVGVTFSVQGGVIEGGKITRRSLLKPTGKYAAKVRAPDNTTPPTYLDDRPPMITAERADQGLVAKASRCNFGQHLLAHLVVTNRERQVVDRDVDDVAVHVRITL